MDDPGNRDSQLGRRTKEIFSIFVSFPQSAKHWAEEAHRTVGALFKREVWHHDFSPQLVLWNGDRPASWAFGQAPNDAISIQQGSPTDTDLHVVLLTASLGKGTLDEMFRRLDAGREFHIFLMDERPRKTDFPSDAAFKAADAAYDDMMAWIKHPTREIDGHVQSLGVQYPANRVKSLDHFQEMLTTLIERHLRLRSIRQGEAKPASQMVLPYAGLRALDEANAPFFFGREGKVDEIVALISQGVRRIILEGGSGTGKSSTVRAGVFPRLREVMKGVDIVAIKPRQHPFNELARALHSLTAEGLSEEAFAERLRKRPEVQIEKLCAARQTPIVIFIDQFEQVYSERVQTKAFFATLECLLRRDEVYLIVAHRADQKLFWTNRSFLPEVRADGSEGFRFHAVELAPLNAMIMDDVVLKPARAASIPLPEYALVEALNRDLAEAQNWLPLMALALSELYDASGRGKEVMTLASYQRMGRIDGIVRRKVEEVEEDCDERLLEKFEALFELLVAVNADGQAIAIGADLEQIVAQGIEAEWLAPLIDGSLLVTDATGVALAHEVYFEQWPRLKEWLDRSRDTLRDIYYLDRDAQRWQAKGQSPSYLLNGDRLLESEQLASTNPDRIAKNPNAEAIRRFLEASRTVQDQMLLHQAIVEGEVRVMLPLLEKGVKLPAPETGRPLAAIHDCIWGPVETEQSILTPDPLGLLNPRSIRVPVAKGLVALHFAALAGRVDKIRLLHALGADLDSATVGGSTALSWAAYAGQAEAVKVLLALGAKLDVPRDDNTLSAIGWAAERGHFEIVDILTLAETGGGQCVSIGTLQNLVKANAYKGNDAGLSVLLPQLMAEQSLTSEDRVTLLTEALWYAVGAHHAACVRLLLAAGADAKRSFPKAKVPRSSIHLAFKGEPDNAGLLATVGELLAHDPELALVADGEGWQAIHFAARRGDVRTLGKLLEYVVSADQMGAHRMTALAWATLGNHARCVEQLLAVGANPNLVNVDGDAPLHLAAMDGLENVARLLLRDISIDAASQNAIGYTPLIIAAHNGHLQIVEALLRTGRAAIDHTDRRGWSALVHAVSCGREAVVERLVAAGARLPLHTLVTGGLELEPGAVAEEVIST